MSDHTVMERLRSETRDAHTQTEALPFFAALAAGTLTLPGYAGYLHALSIVYAALEQELLAAEHHALTAVWDSSLRKLPLIERDLAHLRSHDLPPAPVAALQAQLVAQRIRRRAHDDPVSLLGYLYVLEGSTLGGMVLQAQAARSFGLSPAAGLAYLASYEKATKAHWVSFSGRMNSALSDADEQQRVIAAASEAFTGIAQIVESLYPFEAQPPRDLVRTLNPDAGTHTIPHDQREVQAALRAGERSWRRFPYYEWRYGKRGQQFTRSDSAWLVTLAEHGPAVVEQQIMWLGRVLSSRGMPQWMLELHLDVLHEELVEALPEKQTAYAVLTQTARALREMRRAHISDDVFQTLAATFDRQVGDEWSARLPLTGGLLAAAVADEKVGIAQAVTSIEGWMTDAARFPQTWITAVHTTIRTARNQAR